MSYIKECLHDLTASASAEQERYGFIHTASEIENQPRLWLEAAEVAIRAIPDLQAICHGKQRFLLTGAGSSYFVAASVAMLLRSVYPFVEAIPSTEVVQDPGSSFSDEPFVLVSFARSGDSPEGNAVIQLAEELRPGKAFHIAITCNSSGGLARLVTELGPRGYALLLPQETNDKGLAMTSSFTCMTIAGYLLGYLGKVDQYRLMTAGLSRIAVPFLDTASQFAYAITQEEFSRVFFIASRPSVAAAHEAHLKVQELSAGRLVAKAEDTLGFRHGFMSAVDNQSLVVLFFSEDTRRRAYELDLLRELQEKKLGKRVVIVVPGELTDDLPKGLSHDCLEYDTDPSVADIVRAPLVVLVGQLLGLYFSLSLGLRPDNPSPAGIINRVVSGVVIYPMAN
jgi:tagatose-6-phosphate ketose/aldose isomerase